MVRPKNESGASAVEYGLLVAGIAALILAVVFVLGDAVSNSFEKTSKTVDDATKSEIERVTSLVTVCSASIDAIITSRGKQLKLADSAVVDPRTGATTGDLSGITLGELYEATLDPSNYRRILRLAPASSELRASAC